MEPPDFQKLSQTICLHFQLGIFKVISTNFTSEGLKRAQGSSGSLPGVKKDPEAFFFGEMQFTGVFPHLL